MNGNGHAEDVPRFFRAGTIENVAQLFGYKVDQRVVVRFPARCRPELEAWLRRQGKTGNLSIGFSEGHETWILWEETR